MSGVYRFRRSDGQHFFMIQRGDRGSAVLFAGSSPARPPQEGIVEFDASISDKIAGHCQVNTCEEVSEQSACDQYISPCLVDRGLLSPDSERLGASASIAGCGHEMAPWPEVTVDHGVRRQEPLCLAA